MFEELTQKFDDVFRRLRGRGVLTEANVKESLREVRRALLEADVNFKVAKDFVKAVEARALGEEVLSGLKPGQQVVKVVHDEMVRLLGGSHSGLAAAPDGPTVVMVCGLQGSGKTTTCGKLARRFLKKGKRVLLVAADTQRPAAMDQLAVVGKSVGAEVFIRRDKNAVAICEESLEEARARDFDLVILDTAGRLHVDDSLMVELERIKGATAPHEVLLVLDGLTGQDAVNVAEVFSKRIAFSGIVLTKMDGDARGGAALSVTHVSGIPVKFVGTGERPDGLEDFHPERMASRILGMGDVLSLVERAQEAVDTESALEMAEKLRKEQFTLDDFLAQLEQLKKMGPLEDLLKMIPGMGRKMKGLSVDDKALVRVQALIQSMTPEERRNPGVLNGSRRKRIARGSGTSVQEVNHLLKQFRDMQKMMKMMKNRKGMGRLPLPF
ncbi:MAG: signal recognition particle protein [Gemmatimonadota bacterium]|jgi:signal recognition particle subunit SRP54